MFFFIKISSKFTIMVQIDLRLAAKLGFGLGSGSGFKDRVWVKLNIFGPLTTLTTHYYEEKELLQAIFIKFLKSNRII